MKGPFGVLFPGQGSQFVGMGMDLCRGYPLIAKRVFDEVDAALQTNLSQIIFHGSATQLEATENTQPALLAHSIAVHRILEQEIDVMKKSAPRVMMGHSVGEFSALVAAGCMTLSDAAVLLRLRGRAMQNCVKPGDGMMTALFPVTDIKQLQAVIDVETLNGSRGVCGISNLNSDTQIVISGDRPTVEKVVEKVKKLGLAKKAVALSVSAPFHCKLMNPAATALREALQSIRIRSPSSATTTILSNYSARPFPFDEDINSNNEKVKELLVSQAVSPVRWHESCLVAVKELHVVDFVECGGRGAILSNLIKKIDPSIRSLAISSREDVENFISSQAKQ